MNLFKKLFRIKTAPQETVVPDELVKHYPDPPEKLQTILQRVPNTGIVLYQYIKRFNISKESKYWAMDMMQKWLETPGIVQLAGEDLNMNPFAYSELLDTIFLELGIEVQPETAYCAYAVELQMKFFEERELQEVALSFCQEQQLILVMNNLSMISTSGLTMPMK